MPADLRNELNEHPEFNWITVRDMRLNMGEFKNVTTELVDGKNVTEITLSSGVALQFWGAEGDYILELFRGRAQRVRQQAYLAAGSPYGSSEEGMTRWIYDRLAEKQ